MTEWMGDELESKYVKNTAIFKRADEVLLLGQWMEEPESLNEYQKGKVQETIARGCCKTIEEYEEEEREERQRNIKKSKEIAEQSRKKYAVLLGITPDT